MLITAGGLRSVASDDDSEQGGHYGIAHDRQCALPGRQAVVRMADRTSYQSVNHLELDSPAVRKEKGHVLGGSGMEG